MRILVTGATGLLGSDLCRTLAGRHEITGWARRVPKGTPSQESVDITDSEDVALKMKGLRPEGVIHTAAQSDVDACETDPSTAFLINAKGVETVARAAAAGGAFFIQISTDYVFDGSLDRPYREEDKTNPVQTYGRSKLEGERAALKWAARCLVLRVSGLFGSSRPNFVLSSVRRFQAGQRVPVVADHWYTPSYTLDLAGAIGLLIDKIEKDPNAMEAGGPFYGPLHLANAGGASRLEVAMEIAKILGAPSSLVERTSWEVLNRPAKRPINSRLEIRHFSDLVGTSLRSWAEAVRAFLESEVLHPRENS
ncbi:MAG: dTDP-4-dehydrorhamnose reductase [Candidatus Omnitrophica bacterium]|nr:dTDP-4-dehydrorhamnose reductase [Candidatus Omnitrophota bacterium]